MKHNIFKYIAISAALLAIAVNAGAQYNITGGVGTSKQVTGPDTDGNYTIRLETFATGTTTVTETSTPVDVVLVLDVSGSMAWPIGSSTSQNISLTYDMVANGDQDYFISYSGNYEQVFASYENNRYYLYVSPDITSRVYLTSNGTTQRQTAASYSTTTTGTIVTRNVQVGKSRMHALKDAIGAFIDEIEKNDTEDKSGNPRSERLGNRISIIKFASNTRNTVGNDSYTSGSNTYNYTQIVNHFLPVEGNVETMKASVNGFIPRGATAAGAGMDLANTELQSAMSGHAKVVIMFTDGAPTDTYAAISSANTTKNTRGAIVYSIGVFDETPTPGTNPPSSGSTIWRYMNYVSSNYPNATGIDNPGTGGDYSSGYYQDASSDNADLSAIFVSIAQGIGGAEATVGTSTQVRDVVTNSFVLPNTTSAADVHVYTSAATGDATGADDTNVAGWATPVEITSSVTINIVSVDANGNPTTNPNEAKNKALFVEGFDYSAADSSEGAGDGNWVGVRYKDKKYFWAGKKLIITFKVKADPESTGGESLTNTEKSGVYIFEDGTYTCVNYYEKPHTTLSVNIKIRKTGLRSGESATFELMRIRPKGYNPNGTTPEERVANLEYNLIGKPVPDTHEYNGTATQPDMSDYYEGMGWEGFKKVILTNKGADGAEVVKDILALDPYYVYMVLEDDWGWAYTMTGDTNQVGDDGTYTTSSVEVNPFRFHNTEKTNTVKHAEAIMINHFHYTINGGEFDGKQEEHYKSSKVESFTSSAN